MKLEDWEKKAILDFRLRHPLVGYRRLTYMMLDADVVAESAASVYRVLKRAGVLGDSVPQVKNTDEVPLSFTNSGAP